MKKFLKWSAIVLASIIILIVIMGAGVVVYIKDNRAKLVEMLTTELNRQSYGVWSVDSISVNIWNSYPNIEIGVEEVALYSDSLSFDRDDKTASIKRILFKSNVLELLRDRLSVDELLLDGVELHVKREESGELNIERSLKFKNDQVSSISDKHLSFSVDKLDLQNLKLLFESNARKYKLEFESFKTSFSDSDTTLTLNSSSAKLYGIEITSNIFYHKPTKALEVGFRTTEKDNSMSGELHFDGKSSVKLRSDLKSSLILSEITDNKLKGYLALEGVVDLEVDIVKQQLLNDGSTLRIHANNIESLIDDLKLPDIAKGRFLYQNSSLRGDDVLLNIGENELNIEFSSAELLRLINSDKDHKVELDFKVTAPKFNPYMIRERLGLNVDTINSEHDIRLLSVEGHTALSYNDILSLKEDVVPRLSVRIDNYSAMLPAGEKVSVEGVFIAENRTLLFENIAASIESSKFNLSGEVKIFDDRSSSYFEKITADLRVQSPMVDLKSMSPDSVKSYMRDTELQNLNSHLYIELFPPTVIPSKSLDNFIVDLLDSKALLKEKYCEMKGRIRRSGEQLFIENIDVDYLDIRSEISGVVWVEDSTKIDRFDLKIPKFSFTKLRKKHGNDITFRAIPKEIVVRAAIDDCEFMGEQFDNFRCEISAGHGKSIKMSSVSCDFAGGSADFNAIYAPLSTDSFAVDIDMSFSAIDLEKLRSSRFDKVVDLMKSLRGEVDGEVKGKILFDNLGKIDLNSTFAEVDFTMTSLQLVDYKLDRSISRYFRRYNTKRIGFDTLQNSVTLKDGVITIPRMDIRSTLGSYYVEGELFFGSDSISIDVDVPFNIVSQAAMSRIFGGDGRRESDFDARKARRYVDLHIYGSKDNYNVSLRGKNRDRHNREREETKRIKRKDA